MSFSEAFAEANRFSRLIDAAIEAMKNTTVEYAAAERDYRQAKAEAWVRCPNDEAGVKAGEREWTAARREAWVDADTALLRYRRDLAEGMRQAAVEANRSRRAQLSSVQTFVNAEKAEAEFARTGP
jgi:hypothetical protein